MIKVFGIGNILLCDDAVGVRILEKLIEPIRNLSPFIEGIIGETDCLYCISCITPNDFVIIIDSTYLNRDPGTVSYFTFSQCEQFLSFSQSAHEMNLLSLLKLEYPHIDGYLIGVEISKIDFSLQLSPLLQNQLDSICEQILNFLERVVNTYA